MRHYVTVVMSYGGIACHYGYMALVGMNHHAAVLRNELLCSGVKQPMQCQDWTVPAVTAQSLGTCFTFSKY